MNRGTNSLRIGMSTASLVIALCYLFALATLSTVGAAAAPSKTKSLDELYEKANKEGGKLNLYASLSANSIDTVRKLCRKPAGDLNYPC
jgi:hypothetical protein